MVILTGKFGGVIRVVFGISPGGPSCLKAVSYTHLDVYKRQRSAQLGLILALLPRGAGLFLWLLLVLLAFCGAAAGGALLFGRGAPPFCLEIPPLRLPRPGAILSKTAARLRWYLQEVLPLFIGISVLIWVLRYSGLLALVVAALQQPLASLGLPPETAMVFVYGFLRRDYGAAGLFDLARAGVLDSGQVLTAAVVLTLFVPCVAQVAMLGREYGLKFVLLIVACTCLLYTSRCV